MRVEGFIILEDCVKVLNCLAILLVIVGALNWGLWGFFQFDLVAWICKGNTNGLARLIYSVIGLAGVWNLGLLGKMKCICNCCKCSCHSGKGSGCK